MNRHTEGDQEQTTRDVSLPYLWTFGAIIVLSLIVSVFSSKVRDVPADLQGVWRTSDPAHADRFLELSAVTVSFGTGDGNVSTGLIRKIDEDAGERETVYTITYRGADGDSKVSLIYEPRKRLLRLKNQERIEWTRAGGGSV
jgi:hypothetical protein